MATTTSDPLDLKNNLPTIAIIVIIMIIISFLNINIERESLAIVPSVGEATGVDQTGRQKEAPRKWKWKWKRPIEGWKLKRPIESESENGP